MPRFSWLDLLCIFLITAFLNFIGDTVIKPIADWVGPKLILAVAATATLLVLFLLGLAWVMHKIEGRR